MGMDELDDLSMINTGSRKNTPSKKVNDLTVGDRKTSRTYIGDLEDTSILKKNGITPPKKQSDDDAAALAKMLSSMELPKESTFENNVTPQGDDLSDIMGAEAHKKCGIGKEIVGAKFEMSIPEKRAFAIETANALNDKIRRQNNRTKELYQLSGIADDDEFEFDGTYAEDYVIDDYSDMVE